MMNFSFEAKLSLNFQLSEADLYKLSPELVDALVEYVTGNDICTDIAIVLNRDIAPNDKVGRFVVEKLSAQVVREKETKEDSRNENL